MRHLAALLLLLAGQPLLAQQAAEVQSLPDPLTLEQALSMAQEPHPAIMQAESERDLARSNVDASSAHNGLTVFMEGRLRWVEPPSYAYDQSHNDNKLSLYARKNLYDFGRSAARQNSAEAELRSKELRYLNVQSQRRIEIMQHYFDVLLADLMYAHDDEAMAIAYVTLDKLRKRHELGQVSDIDLMQQEAAYQQSRSQRSRSEARQRSSREMLAIALNRPGQPPSNLQAPDFGNAVRSVPEYSELLEKALRNNPQLRALREELVSSQERLAGARAGYRPTLLGEAEASAYSRELPTNDPFRVGIVLTVPLYTGGAVDASIGQEQARLFRSQAALRAAEDDIRQNVLFLWQELEQLRIKNEEVRAQLAYRELYLDRSRANYEMEISTDLGDAMVLLSDVQMAQATVQFQTALTWERLSALMGESPVSPTKQ